jgi:hypothetical protein
MEKTAPRRSVWLWTFGISGCYPSDGTWPVDHKGGFLFRVRLHLTLGVDRFDGYER